MSFDRDFDSLSFLVSSKLIESRISKKLVENSSAVGQGGEAFFKINFNVIFGSTAIFLYSIDAEFDFTSIDV
jgi:hypothetical protein